MKITIAAVCASVMLLSTSVTVFSDVSFSFGGKALPENVSGKNLTAGSGYLWDEKEDYEGSDGSLLVKYWSDFCRLNFDNVFKDCILNNDAVFKISFRAKLGGDAKMENCTIYPMVLDEEYNPLYNYDNSDAGITAVLSKNDWTLVEMEYKLTGNEIPYAISIQAPSYANINNIIPINIDSFSLVQTDEGVEAEAANLGNYAAAYSFDNERNIPSYISGKKLKVGVNVLLDSSLSCTNPKGKSIHAIYWANYCRLILGGLFSEAAVLTGDECTVAAYVRIN